MGPWWPRSAPTRKPRANNLLVNLDMLTTPLPKAITRFARALSLTDGTTLYSPVQNMTVLAGTTTTGTFMVHTFNYTAANGKGAVYFGVGGTDTLNLGMDRQTSSASTANHWPISRMIPIPSRARPSTTAAPTTMCA